MNDAVRIRIAAAATAIFIGGLAGTGIALRSGDDPAPPMATGTPAAGPTASVAARSGSQPHAALISMPRQATSRISPGVAGPPAGEREGHERESSREAIDG